MSPLDRWYIDLSLVAFLTGLAVLTVVSGVTGPLRTAVVVPLVTILPGYAALSVLYPTAGNHAVRTFDENERGLKNPLPTKDGVNTLERYVFAVITSLVIVPAVALVVNFTPWGITLNPLLFGLAGLTQLFTAGGLLRRLRLPAERRYSPKVSHVYRDVLFSDAGSAFSSGPDRVRLFNVALGICLLIFASSVGYAAINPPQGEGFTEFYVETEDVDGDTELLYPGEFASGESRELAVNVTNQEHEDVRYDVVVQLQRLDSTASETTVVDENRLASRTATLAHRESRTMTFDVAPAMRGSDLRLVLYLYRGDAPEDPSVDGAYQTLRLPITVGDSA